MRLFIAILFAMSLAGCIKHSTNPTVDTAIHVVENAYPSDNILEEGAEEEIEEITGLDVDLSPGSAEKDDNFEKYHVERPTTP